MTPSHTPDLEYTSFDCIVIGGGAAGLMCAAQAAQRGKSVAILDHANKVGKKILMSGGGRCNFTNYYVEPSNYLCSNPHFCKSALSRYTQYDFLELVHKHNIPYHEKTLGQLFCDNKAKDILNALLAECDQYGVRVTTHCSITHLEAIAPEGTSSSGTEADFKRPHFEHPIGPENKHQARYRLQTSLGEYRAHSVVIATGGLSIPTMGATGFGYDIAKQFGLRITPKAASLVPFTFKGALLERCQQLAGLSLNVTLQCHDQAFTEGLLFTHKGLSGPAALQISNYWFPEDPLEINFLPEEEIGVCLEQWQSQGDKSSLKNLLSQHLPKRFVLTWLCQHLAMESMLNKTVFDLSNADKQQLIEAIHHYICIPNGTEGFKTAEVTRGGVNTDDISSKTFEAKQVAGLFFIGEVLDVTGWLGGFNFQWAWASGYCAARYV